MSIGQFGGATRLTVKALRLYDRKGIVKPAFTDPKSAYRYYDHGQMKVANQIRELRGLEADLALVHDPQGFPLVTLPTDDLLRS